jgi:multidrug transporter EmrE-like cation transporter
MNKGENKRMFALVLVGLSILLGACGQILMKHGMSQLGEINGISQLVSPNTLLKLITNWAVILGVILYIITLPLWLGALSTLNVSFMYPLLSLGYIITAVIALIFLKENITLLRWVGTVVVIIGCFFIGRA